MAIFGTKDSDFYLICSLDAMMSFDYIALPFLHSADKNQMTSLQPGIIIVVARRMKDGSRAMLRLSFVNLRKQASFLGLLICIKYCSSHIRRLTGQVSFRYCMVVR